MSREPFGTSGSPPCICRCQPATQWPYIRWGRRRFLQINKTFCPFSPQRCTSKSRYTASQSATVTLASGTRPCVALPPRQNLQQGGHICFIYLALYPPCAICTSTGHCQSTSRQDEEALSVSGDNDAPSPSGSNPSKRRLGGGSWRIPQMLGMGPQIAFAATFFSRSPLC